jgi:hypothetical protein
MGWFITTRVEQYFWTWHGTEDFLVRREAERVIGQRAFPMAFILMGACCSEELTSKPNETAARVGVLLT